MLKDYGTTMDEKEFEDFKEKSALREKEADEYLKGDKEAQELGIKSYRELRESLDKGKTDEKVEALHSKIYFKDNVYLFWEMQSRESLIASYENPLNRNAELYSSKPNKYKRLKELEKGDQLKSVLSYVTFLNYDSLITNFSILVVVTLAFIIIENSLELLGVKFLNGAIISELILCILGFYIVLTFKKNRISIRDCIKS